MSARKQRALPQHIRRACAAVLRAAETYQSMSDDELMSPGKTENDQVYEGKRTLADFTGIKEELQTMGVVAGGGVLETKAGKL